MPNRTRIAINIGNLLELAGAGVACYAVSRLAGVAWALLLAGVLIVVAANLIFDASVVRFRVPQPRRSLARARFRAGRRLRNARRSLARRVRR